MTTQQMWAVDLLDENLLRRNKSFQRRPDWSSSKSSSRTSTHYNEEVIYTFQVKHNIEF